MTWKRLRLAACWTCFSAIAGLAAGSNAADDRILGTPLVEAGGDVIDHGVSALEYGAHAFGQVPFGRYLQASATYEYLDWHNSVRAFNFHEMDDVLAGSVTAYYHTHAVTPFGGASLQRTWWSVNFDYADVRVVGLDGHADSWNAFCGVEVPVMGCVVTATARYTDQLHSDSVFETAITTDYAVEVHRWLSRRIGVFAFFDRYLPRAKLVRPSTLYSTGLRLRF